MARKKHNTIDAARQALSKATKASVKARKRKASGLLREFQRTRAAALKAKRQTVDRELVAQWRALAKLGYVNAKVRPGKKNLTPFRRTEIRKALTKAQSQAAFVGGKTVRPLERHVTTTTIERTNISTGEKKVSASTRVYYSLGKNFKFIKTKNVPSQPTGFVKTRKGLIFEALPEEKITVTKTGKVKRDLRKRGGFLITAEGVTGEDILVLADKIREGKFKLRRGQFLDVYTFGSYNPHPYDDLSLMDFVHRLEYYERAMQTNVFQSYLDKTEIHVLTR